MLWDILEHSPTSECPLSEESKGTFFELASTRDAPANAGLSLSLSRVATLPSTHLPACVLKRNPEFFSFLLLPFVFSSDCFSSGFSLVTRERERERGNLTLQVGRRGLRQLSLAENRRRLAAADCGRDPYCEHLRVASIRRAYTESAALSLRRQEEEEEEEREMPLLCEMEREREMPFE